jgi:16S rRNA processing protein RimM
MKRRPRTRQTLTKSDHPIGRIAGTFGLRGELKCDPTSAGRALFVPRAKLDCTTASGHSETVTVESVREHKSRLLIALAEARDATAAERYVGATFFAPREALDVAEGEYLDVDLAGCEVVSIEGHAYGTVDAVEHYPASDMLIVAGRMLPMVKAFIRDVDLGSKRITVEVPPGLLDDETL